MGKKIVDWSILAACMTVIIGCITIITQVGGWLDRIKDGYKVANCAYADVSELKPRVYALEKECDIINAKLDTKFNAIASSVEEVRNDVRTLINMHLSNKNERYAGP